MVLQSSKKPEEIAREDLDKMLELSGWKVQDLYEMKPSESIGVAVTEAHLKVGFSDYLLFADRRPVGIIEAKPKGFTLSGVAEQSEKYAKSSLADLLAVNEPLPFCYESTGDETNFRDRRDPDARSRRVFSFHRPETLKGLIEEKDTLRSRLIKTSQLVPLDRQKLWDCQYEAIQNLEKSLADNRPRSLIQMATGSGKTYTAVSFINRLIKFSKAKRVLFLVDRNNLGEQTLREFDSYPIPGDGRLFTKVYNVQHLKSNSLDPVCKVCITTIQRLYSMLKGEKELDPELEEESAFDRWADFSGKEAGKESEEAKKERTIDYNPDIPIEYFDFIVTDECHRSIYHLWRQVLEYFDAFIIGLTATPSNQTLGFFNKNLVMEYSHERAVADGVNVGYEVYRIKTEITEKGSKVEAGFYIDKRDKLTRKIRWEQLDDEFSYDEKKLDHSVVSKDQIRTVIRTFKEKLFTEIFPGRSEVPKTLIFAKDDSHAEDIVEIIREEFGKGNDFCKKITYRVTGEDPKTLIKYFRNKYYPRIVVTVDMISTGTDIKPLECVLFMRDVRSSVYFEQMKGRGTRTINLDDMKEISPDCTKGKTHFIIVDAVGICESDKTDSRPLERKKTVPFDKILIQVAFGSRDEDTLTTLAGRLARLDREITSYDREKIENESGGKSLSVLTNALLDAVDPDVQEAKAKILFNTDSPSSVQLEKAREILASEACAPFDSPTLRNLLIDLHRKNEQVIDTVSEDRVLYAGFDADAKEKAQKTIENFHKFIEENKDELTALQIIYNTPYGKRHLTYRAIKQLAESIEKPPYYLTPEKLWQAYEALDLSKVKQATPGKLLTNIVSILRFELGESDILEPFPDTVESRFEKWLSAQEASGRTFSEEQKEWLRMIKDHIASSLDIEVEDFENVPFNRKGGAFKAYELFGEDLVGIMEELSEVLTG
ncbi:type I restriction endonuclease subunit R [Methanosarcina vacuolata]|uniref:Type I restriction-modification system, restriction subunit R n=1 Tax=Methanosarcina vacuolata Z-761 TaxID=1434123 RepID=A0A0E3Q894_9EURY|nr:type I restriction-modification enzyme R subunit C-terminal domain-containing protein [Methanosarcina vacuolata]AKB44848.1 Type I restriction-modification system, restriction subunit R [Methanosarcina vacuolata Z-761]